ncbi:hypothetical protein DL98DRAFT_594537 [Cadophora sp. DSE1049]|nr:hypothetical protein DL98DRAFT_594537 [Cadophora sp. DSE1049]
MAPSGKGNSSRQKRRKLPNAPEPNKRIRHASISSENESISSEASEHIIFPQSNAGGDKSPVVGLDHGSTMSAMVVTDTDGKHKPVDRYPGAPQPLYDGDSITQVPSKVTVIAQGGVPKFKCGYEAGAGRGTTFTGLKLMIGMGEGEVDDDENPEEFEEARKTNRQKLENVNCQLRTPLTFKDLVRTFLEYMHDHLVWWCDKSDLGLPRRTVAAYPLRWERKPETVLTYQEIVEEAGFQNVDTLNEAEAAANTIFADRPTAWFQEKTRAVVIDDNGGTTHDWVAYHVQKFGEVITKGEIWKYGGEGGMALVVDFATSMIAEIVRREVKVVEYVQAFMLDVRSYIPPEEATPEDEPYNKDGLLFGNPPILLTHNQMKMLYELALRSITDAAERFRGKFEAIGVEEVYVVGGTSKQRRWFQPGLEKALGNLKVVYPPISPSTFIAEGATYAAYCDCVTSSRLNNLHLGHLVSREDHPSFRDKKVWPKGKIFEVVEILKPKGGSLFADGKKAEWHWLQVENWEDKTFGDVLENTEVRVFATGKEKLINLVRHALYYDAIPKEDFNLEVEPRHVFNKPEIEAFLKLIKRNKKRFQYFYAIRFLSDGLGIRLEAGWRKDFTKGKDGIKVKDLGRIKFLVNS